MILSSIVKKNPYSQFYNSRVSKVRIQTIAIFLSILTSFILFCDHAIAQKNLNDIKYINHGLISSSKVYEITRNAQFIVFTIQNNTGRTINNIYPWIYKNYIDPDDGKEKYLLVNNVHRGGIRLAGIPHRPKARVDWRFALVRGNSPADPVAIDYLLMIHTKSIDYTNLEPPIIVVPK